jgi:hypothetical protein
MSKQRNRDAEMQRKGETFHVAVSRRVEAQVSII